MIARVIRIIVLGILIYCSHEYIRPEAVFILFLIVMNFEIKMYFLSKMIEPPLLNLEEQL